MEDWNGKQGRMEGCELFLQYSIVPFYGFSVQQRAANRGIQHVHSFFGTEHLNVPRTVSALIHRPPTFGTANDGRRCSAEGRAGTDANTNPVSHGIFTIGF